MNAPVRIRDADAAVWRPKVLIRHLHQHHSHVMRWRLHLGRLRAAQEAKDRQNQVDAHVRAWKVFSSTSKADLRQWPLTVRSTLIEVCTTQQVPVAEVLGQSRKAGITYARQVAMHRIKQETGRSLPWIGRLFSRDHTTVLHAIRKIEAERGQA